MIRSGHFSVTLFWNHKCRHLFVIGKKERWAEDFMDKRGTRKALLSYPRG